MDPGVTPIPPGLIDALLKFRCPESYKEILLTFIRLSGTYENTHRKVPYSFVSRFLNREKYKVVNCLDKLVECRILKETRNPRFPEARCLMINGNYSEWTYSKLPYDGPNCPAAECKTPEIVTQRPEVESLNSEPELLPRQKIQEKYSKSCPGKKHLIKNSKIRKIYHSPLHPDRDKMPQLPGSGNADSYTFCRQSQAPVLCSCVIPPDELLIPTFRVRTGKSPPLQPSDHGLRTSDLIHQRAGETYSYGFG